MEDDVVDFSNVPEDWLTVAYTEYGKWYLYDNAPYTIKQCRNLQDNDIITMVQKRIYKTDTNGNKIPTSKMELLIRRRR